MHITAQFLRDNDACGEQVDLFVQTFGEEGGELTRANLVKAAQAGLSVHWLVPVLGINRDDYNRAIPPHYNTFEASIERHRMDYDKHRAKCNDALREGTIDYFGFNAMMYVHDSILRKATKPYWELLNLAVANTLADLLHLD